MRKALCLILFLAICCASPIQAHRYKMPKKVSRTKKFAATVGNRVSTIRHRVSRAQALQTKAHASLAALPDPLNKAVFTVKENHRILRHLRRGTVTSFVIEETYQGKKFLWGVTTPHVHVVKSAVVDHQMGLRLKIPATYSTGLSDIAIFKLPEELTTQVVPLHLAEQNPVIGETLYSVGFFENEYHLGTGHVVQEVGPNRIITSLAIDRSCVRAGACGGPLLNKDGDVVGVHVGNHNTQDIGFDVPVQEIHKLLKDIHQGKVPSYQPLMFNGRQIGTIASNQRIRLIKVYRNGQLIQTHKTHFRENELDYAHLEQFIKETQADKLVLNITENILPSRKDKYHFRAFVLTYDSSTGESVLKRNDLKHPFYVYVGRRINKSLINLLTIPND